MNKTLTAAAALALLLPAAADAACTQAMLGTAAKPLTWAIHANAASGNFFDCMIEVRGKNDVRGPTPYRGCLAKGMTNRSAISRSASWIQVDSSCVLTGKLVTPNVVVRIVSGTNGSMLVLDGAWISGMRIKGRMDKPLSSEAFFGNGVTLN